MQDHIHRSAESGKLRQLLRGSKGPPQPEDIVRQAKVVAELVEDEVIVFYDPEAGHLDFCPGFSFWHGVHTDVAEEDVLYSTREGWYATQPAMRCLAGLPAGERKVNDAQE